VEIGIGDNPDAARIAAAAGLAVLCTDIRRDCAHEGLTVVADDLFSPTISLYEAADLIYAIRPGIEMLPALIDLARRVDADLLVYHLGHEIYGDGGEIVHCGGIVLHRYHRRRGSLEEG